jgi:hypothetical protein
MRATADRDDFSFGHWTMPLRPVTPARPFSAVPFVKPSPRVPNPTPTPSARRASMMPTPLTAPPPSARRALAIGFTIGTSLGLAILGAAWHFLL